MSQSQAPYMTTPKVDALSDLLQVFTPEQLQLIARRCKAMQERGYGDVTIRFNNSHPRFLLWSESEEMPKS